MPASCDRASSHNFTTSYKGRSDELHRCISHDETAKHEACRKLRSMISNLRSILVAQLGNRQG